MEKLSFKVAEFEGPLDLMLHLISKHKLDIYDIQISLLLEQYIEAVSQLQRENLEIASEFLEMVSRLIYIKTVMLLPKHEESGEQLKAQLQGELLEYQMCKEVAGTLRKLSEENSLFVRAPMPLPPAALYEVMHTPKQLYRAYQDAVGKGMRKLPPPESAFKGIVSRRIVSVNARIIYVMRRLYRKGRVSFDSLFTQSTSRSELVATFLAVLELSKGNRIEVNDECTMVQLKGR